MIKSCAGNKTRRTLNTPTNTSKSWKNEDIRAKRPTQKDPYSALCTHGFFLRTHPPCCRAFVQKHTIKTRQQSRGLPISPVHGVRVEVVLVRRRGADGMVRVAHPEPTGTPVEGSSVRRHVSSRGVWVLAVPVTVRVPGRVGVVVETTRQEEGCS